MATSKFEVTRALVVDADEEMVDDLTKKVAGKVKSGALEYPVELDEGQELRVSYIVPDEPTTGLTFENTGKPREPDVARLAVFHNGDTISLP